MRHVMLILGLCLPIGVVSAQTFGAITGEVKDPSGAVAPNASVIATNVATNVARTTTTNDAGVYTFPDLIPATYQVKVTVAGFQTATSTIEIQVQQTARVDFTLVVGQSTQTVEVDATAAALTTESATVGTVIAQKAINDLPLNGRNFVSLVALAPNVNSGFSAASIASSRQGGDRTSNVFTISVAGMRSSFNQFSLDGVADTDPNFNTYIQVPSIDAIQEFKVQQGIYPAEFGREAAQINVSTKSGTNDFHGTAYEFLRNDDTDAKPYNFNTGVAPPRLPLKQNQYGYFLGGPVWLPKIYNGKNKLFFSSNWEGYKQRITTAGTDTVATAAWRAGNFSAFPTTLYDPNTRVSNGNGGYTATPFPGNVIPTQRLDPTSQALYAYLPLPNLNPNNSTNPANNLVVPLENQVNKNQVTERVDFNQSANMQWFGRFGWTNETTQTPTLPNIGGALSTNSKQYMLSNAWVLSPTKVNEFRFGYTSIYNALDQILSGKTNVVANLGLPFPAELPQSWGVPSVALNLNGLSTFGDSTNGPFVINDSIRQFIDNFSWNHGKHSIRFGGEYRYDIFNQFGNQYTRSQLQFNGQYTANPINLGGGNAAADFGLGDPFRIDLALQVAQSNYTANSFAFYVDDTYKMTSKITVTLGLRWEVEQPWLDTQQNMTNFYLPNGANLPQQSNLPQSQWPILERAGNNNNFYQGLNYTYVNLTGLGPAGPVPVARDGRLGARMVNTDWANFAPRFGIAYSPSPKWSIRLGAGVFYSLDSMNNRFDTNRATAGRLTDLPSPQAAPTLTYGNSLGAPPYLLNPGLTWAVQSNIGTPTAYEYLLNVQRQFGQGSTLEVGYQGIEDRHLENQLNLDAGIPNGFVAPAAHVPYPIYSSGIEYTDGNGIGNYNAVSGKFTQRYKSGLTTIFAFTWSKALDNGSAIRGMTGDQYPENPYCIIQCEYGPSGFNTPYRMVTTILYELPFGKNKQFLNKGGVSNVVVGGWQLSTIVTAQSGRALDSVSWDAGGQVVQPNANRLDSTGINPTASNADQHEWFNKSAFTNVVAATCVNYITPGCYNNTFGNMGRDNLIGPSTYTADASLFKTIAIKERMSFQLRFEFFNVLNHPALGSPNTNWNTTTQTPAATFGVINNSATAIGTAYAMRQIQFGAKFIF